MIDTGLLPEFQVVDRNTASILTATVGAAVQNDTRLMIDRVYIAAKRSNIAFNVATIPRDFNAPSRGPFDPITWEPYIRPAKISVRARHPSPINRRPIQTARRMQPQDPVKAGAQ